MAALEWLDPVYAGGHWVPEMIAAAGGEDVLGEAGRRSRVVDWDERRGCAAGAGRASCRAGSTPTRPRRRRASTPNRCAALGAERVVAVDAASSFSRPGPRLVDGVELLAHLLHPGAVPAPAGIAHEALAARGSEARR